MPRPIFLKETAQKQLIQAGLRAFIRQGFNGAGVRDILQAAKVPSGSFYYYFDSKEALAAAVVDRYAELSRQKRASLLLGDPSVSPLKRLRNYFEAYVHFSGLAQFRQGCLLGALTLEIANASPLVMERIRVAFSEWERMLEEVLAEAANQGQLPPGLAARELSAFIVIGWEGALLRMKAEQSEKPLRLFIDTLFQGILRVEKDQ
ncbi:TetR/AcrR family transcriptional regulator [Piscinibacter sp. XHJ-5]|uniref:TetR/AcrR family transcriptional regulator n=1 Tax=Piscinibacter sp. XHJ-5 TaxID=3037797 RepID=UPI0024536990|nr:TetR/AcrR family transcriptional regulator [Piscinibacter sp. XHJ-5]